MKRKSKTVQAAEAAIKAKQHEACVLDGVPSEAAFARGYGEQAQELMRVEELPTMGAGGEVVQPVAENSIHGRHIRNTLAEPDAAAIDASRERMELAMDAGCVEMAIDAAASVEAGNSIEKMLAHQMAACHNTAMEMIAEATEPMHGVDHNTISVIQSRKLNAANRLMQTFQQAMLTLQKSRTGGKQTVTVLHVNVNDGGQAVVTGNMGGGRPSGGKDKK